MAIHIECGGCHAKFNVLDELQGKKVRCPKCKQPIIVLAPGRDESAIKPAPSKTQPGRPSAAIVKGPPPLPARGTPRPRDTEDEKSRPKRRPSERAYRDDDDSEDRPAGRVRKQKIGLPWILGGVGGGIALLLVIILMLRGSNARGPEGHAGVEGPIAQNNPPPTPVQDTRANLNPAPRAPQPVSEPPPKQVEIPAGDTPREINSEDVKKVKNSTTFLSVKFGDGKGGEGSGFFAAEKGLVFTNAHVLGMKGPSSSPPKSIDIVVHSGEKEEFTRQGKVLGVDRENDLAVLQAEGGNVGLPEPLPVDTTRNLTELQKVYVFGFPLGTALGKNITVSESSVSSLRKSADGTVYEVQVNGGMHNGNSGGPVVDSRGVVIGVAVSGVLGTQLNFAVPGEKVQGLLRGRVASLAIGETYLKDARVKLPIEFTFLDPMSRLQDVQVDVWSGNHGPARPLTLERPSRHPSDGPRQTTPLPFQNNKATAEIDLPSVENGMCFWIQPVLTDKAGVRHWGTATAYKMADYAPLERKPVLLQHQFEGQGIRTVKFGNAIKDVHVKAGKESTTGIHFEMDAVESPSKNPNGTGGLFRLYAVNARLSVELDGKPIADSPQMKLLDLLRGKYYSYIMDPSGALRTRTLPRTIGRNLLGGPDFQDFAMFMSNAFEMTLLPLPNRQVQPKETWDTVVPFIGGMGKKEVIDVQLKCTLEGIRALQGQNQAVITLAGTMQRRTGTFRFAGKVTGKAYFAIDKGFIAQVKLKKEPAGTDDSQYVEVNLTRALGNTTGMTPPAPPPPPPVLAKGKVLFQSGAQVLGPGDLTNYPEKPGCPYKVYSVKLAAGKSYIIEMNKTDTSPLDPFLILQNSLNQKLAFDDDGGGDLNARIVYTAPATGLYQVIATTLAPNLIGQFQLTVAELAATKNAPTLAAQSNPKSTIVKNSPAANSNLGNKAASASDNTITGALAALGNTNHFVRKKAAEYLSSTPPTATRRGDVIRALTNYLRDPDFFIRKAVIAAYGNWMTKEQAEGLYPALSDENVFVRRSAMEILSRFPSAAAAKEIAKRLRELSDQSDAAKALEVMGSVAEPAVLPLLQSSDWVVRMESCKILGAIGTMKSLPDLQARLGDSNRLVSDAARDALGFIQNRPKQ